MKLNFEKTIQEFDGFAITRYASEVVSYDVRDSKGRAVGGFATIVHSPPTMSASTDEGWRTIVTGPAVFRLSIHSTRNGQTFGAIPRSTLFSTLKDAEAGAIAGLQRAAKRAKKYAEKGEGRQWAKP